MATGLFDYEAPSAPEEEEPQGSSFLDPARKEAYYGRLTEKYERADRRRNPEKAPPGLLQKEISEDGVYNPNDLSSQVDRYHHSLDDGGVGDSIDRALDASKMAGAPIDESAVTPPWTKLMEENDPEQGVQGRDVFNFLFGPEMAILGAQWDQEGWQWDLEIAKQQWAEHPFMSSLAAVSLITTVIPGVNLVTKSAKVGALAKSGIGSKSLLKEGFTGWEDQLQYMLRQIDHTTPDGKPVYTFFDDTAAAKLQSLSPEKALDAVGGSKYVKKLLLGQDHYNRFLRYTTEAAAGTASKPKQLWLKWHEQFANTYAFTLGDDIKRKYIDDIHDFFTSADFKTLMDPDALIPEAHHLTWFKYMQRGIDDTASEFRAMPTEIQNRFKEMERIFKQQQDAKFAEGFIDEATYYDRVGDIHVPAVHKGTPELQVSDSVLQLDGARRPFRRPKLGSPTLEGRKRTKAEILQKAEEGKLITDPTVLTEHGYVRDQLLFNSHRVLRDLVYEAGITKQRNKLAGHFLDYDEYAKMTPKQKRNWIDTNNLPEAHTSTILHRMISTKAARDGVELPSELPVMSKKLMSELMGDGGLFHATHASASLFEVLTSIHKTMKCLTAGHRVLTDQGYLKIEDLGKYTPGFNHDVPEEAPKVWSPELETWVPIRAFYHEQNVETIKLTLSDGTILEGTPKHPIQTKNGLKRLSEIELKDEVPQVKTDQFPSEMVQIPVNLWKSAVGAGNESLTFNEDIAELVGWILGDGQIYLGDNGTHSVRITIGAEDIEFSSGRLAELCDRMGLHHTLSEDKREDRNIFYFCINSRSFVRLLEYIGITERVGHYSKRKLIVPEIVFRSPKPVVIAFMRGLFETDGGVYRKNIDFNSVSEPMARDFHLLLKSLGIRASIHRFIPQVSEIQGRPVKPKPCWKILFGSAASCKIIYDYDMIRMPRKAARLRNLFEGKKFQKQTKLRVKRIEKFKNKDVYDISLDAPHLFVSQQIVNHNTVANPSTQAINIAGNLFGFLPMAGYNIFNPRNINDGRMLSKLMTFISDVKFKQGIKAEDLFGVKGRIQGMLEESAKLGGRKGQNAKEILEWSTGVSSKTGTKFNLLDELSDPTVTELVEFSAFDSVEGLSHLEEMFQGMLRASEAGKDNVGTMSKFVAQMFLKGAGVGQPAGAPTKVLKNIGFDLGDKTVRQTSLHKASAAYLQGDIVPKMMYYLDLRRNAFNIQNAVFETGRRMPQYKRIGPALARSRRYFLPWVSFPAETARIMKNNMMDHPLMVLPFLEMPSIVQGLFSATGAGVDIASIEQTKEAAPAWANKATSVFLEGEGKAGSVLGGLAGGFTGGVAGALSYGPLGALVGTAGAGAMGAALGHNFTKDEKSARSWVLDFLPHSSLMPATTADTGADPISAFYDATPLEPLAVLTPLVRVTLGKGSFGQDLPVENVQDAVSKMALGLFGFLSPPLMQKYGMYVGEPKRGMLYMGDFDAGAAGVVGGAAALSGAGPLGVATGAAAGGFIGFNTTRLGQDLGLEVNPRTGSHGNPFLDFFVKGFSPIKSWKASPEQMLFNESLQRSRFRELRSLYQRRMDDSIMNGRDSDFNAAIGDIYRTFSKEYRDNPRKAQNKFREYMDRRMGRISRHPSLSRWSEEDLRRRLREASNFAAETRGQIHNQLIEAIVAELRNRGSGGVGYDTDWNFDGTPVKSNNLLSNDVLKDELGLF